MPEPMRESGSDFVVVSSGADATCSTTVRDGCTVLPMSSSAFAAVFLSGSGALLLKNMSTPVFAGMQCRKGQGCRVAIERELTQSLYSRAGEDSQVRTPFENRTAQTRTATTMEPTIASHSVYGAVSGISLPNNSRIAPPIRTSLCHLPVRGCFVQKNWDNCGAWGTQTSKKSSSVAFRSQERSHGSSPSQA